MAKSKSSKKVSKKPNGKKSKIGTTKKKAVSISKSGKRFKLSSIFNNRLFHNRISKRVNSITNRIPVYNRLSNIQKTILFLLLIVLFVSFNVWLFWGVPLPTKIAQTRFPVSTKLYDRNDNLIFEIYADRRSTPLPLDEIPDYVKEATISIEDKDFYHHFGVSFTGIARAAYKTLFKQKLEGGSTLTQQLVKNSLLTSDRTIKRKIRELALTFAVEIIYTKDQILEIYLNQIPYGSTAYGIGAASELYFGKEAKDLTLAEASLLAGLPAAPTRFSPFGAHPELAKGRQEAVLRRMVEDKHITQEQMDEALAEELHYAQANAPEAPHFALWIKDQLAEEYGDAVVEQGGLRVKTTLDLELQDFAQKAVATEVAKLSKSNVGNGAAIVVRPKTGEILAMVGSKDFFADDEDGKVNIIFAKRQPGSSIKPLNYALAIQNKKLTASSPLADVPTCFAVFGQSEYCPKNYDGSFHGAPQLRFALANSYNIPAVRTLALNGIDDFIDFATKMGITTFTDPANYGLSLTLGGGEVRPYDMAQAFSVLANQGVKQELYAIEKVEDYKGNTLFEVNRDALDKGRVMDPGAAFIISDILKDNGARSAAFGSSSLLNVKGHPEVSVKTGTTNDLRDNWTIGYTEFATVAVWVGNNDNTAMSGAVSGVSGASPIWNTVMKEVMDKAEKGFYDEEESGHPLLKQPEDVVGATVCSDNGNVAGAEDNPGCPTRFEYFLKDAVGSRIEWGATDIAINKTTGQQVYSDQIPPEFIEMQNHPFLLDPLGTLYCVNCLIASDSARISYPLKK